MRYVKFLAVLLTIIMVGGVATDPVAGAHGNKNIQIKHGDVYQKQHKFQYNTGDGHNKNVQVGISKGGWVKQKQGVVQINKNSGDGYQTNKNAQVAVSKGGSITQKQGVVQVNENSNDGSQMNGNTQTGVSSSSN